MKIENVNIKTIPEDKVVSIKIGGIFYQRLNKLAIEFGDGLGKEGLVQALLQIKHKKTANNSDAYNLETLISLVKEIETQFEKDGHTINNEIELEVPDEFKSVRDSKVETDESTDSTPSSEQ
jgi:hypothetical protein